MSGEQVRKQEIYLGMSKVYINCDQLAGLYHMAMQNGTFDAFGDLAIEWAKKAEIEINSLRAEVEALKDDQDKWWRRAVLLMQYLHNYGMFDEDECYPCFVKEYPEAANWFDEDCVQVEDALRGEGEK